MGVIPHHLTSLSSPVSLVNVPLSLLCSVYAPGLSPVWENISEEPLEWPGLDLASMRSRPSLIWTSASLSDWEMSMSEHIASSVSIFRFVQNNFFKGASLFRGRYFGLSKNISQLAGMAPLGAWHWSNWYLLTSEETRENRRQWGVLIVTQTSEVVRWAGSVQKYPGHWALTRGPCLPGVTPLSSS